jgi:hypothetical protein
VNCTTKQRRIDGSLYNGAAHNSHNIVCRISSSLSDNTCSDCSLVWTFLSLLQHVQRQANRGTKNALKDRELPHMQASKVCFLLKCSHTFPCFLGISVACAAGPSVNRTIQLLQV